MRPSTSEWLAYALAGATIAALVTATSLCLWALAGWPGSPWGFLLAANTVILFTWMVATIQELNRKLVRVRRQGAGR